MTPRSGVLWLLLIFALSAPGQTVRPMALDQSRYEVAAGEPVPLAASTATVNFLLGAASRTLTGDAGIVAAPDKAGDQIMLAVPLRTKPGEYTATLTATSATGEQQQTSLTVMVKPRQTVPSTATRPPVVLLNGWETGFTGSCPVSSNSSAAFGNLAQYLMADGVPAVYFFDNCAEDPNKPIETLAGDLGQFLTTITYDNGQQVPQIDLVGFSMGGLIARAYLAGLQTNGSLAPPANTLVRDLVLIATPNFGSFLATNNAGTFAAGTQSAEMISGSSFLWNLATWNQRVDDLRGVNAVAVIGNAGTWVNTGTGISLTNGSDGVVSTTSASLGFLAQQPNVTRIVPYCHVDSGSFTNTSLGALNCNSGSTGIANITGESHPTSQIIRSFLGGTSDWQSIGSTPTADPLLSIDGGTFFAMVNGAGNYVTDMTQVGWGTLLLQVGGDQGTIFFTDYVSGTGDYQVTSQSLGTVDCGTLSSSVGYYAAARCKINAAIVSVGPLANLPGRVINPGIAITISGEDFGFLCNGCKVVATPAGSTTGSTLSVSAWNNTSITAQLPANLSGLLTISVLSETGNDSITIMVAAPATITATPGNLQFTGSVGGADPAAQTITISNTGNGTLAWTATASAGSNGSWLSVTAASGSASGTNTSTISVSASATGLNAGTYTGSIQITASGASNSPVSVPVTLIVAAAPAVLTVAPQTLAFQYSVGGAVPDAQTISIANAGTGTLTWTASASDSWLSVAAPSGTAPAGLSVTVNPANLAAGTYTGSVQISSPGATGSPASVAVTLVLQGTQPAGAITGITNAASFQPSFAPATWVAIFGTNLSQTTYTWQPGDIVNGQLPTSLHGVSVTINGIPAYVQYISPTQINALAPDDGSVGSTAAKVAVQVTTAGQASNTITGQEQQFGPAFLTIGNGKYVAAEHGDYSLIGPAGLIPGVTTQPARPGEIVMLYATGFGPTNPASPTGQLVTTAAVLANSVQVTIGGVTANVGYAGLVEAGVYQFNVTIPAGLANGDAAILASVSGIQTQTGVSITVQQ